MHRSCTVFELLSLFPKLLSIHVTMTTTTQGTVCNPNAKTLHGEPMYKIWSLLLQPFQRYFRGNKNLNGSCNHNHTLSGGGFLARDVIYTSRAYAIMPVSVCLWRLCIGNRMLWIPDIFACLDEWMSLLLTDNASPGSSDRMMPGFLVEVGGGYGKIGNCSDITYFTLLRVWTGNTWHV